MLMSFLLVFVFTILLFSSNFTLGFASNIYIRLLLIFWMSFYVFIVILYYAFVNFLFIFYYFLS